MTGNYRWLQRDHFLDSDAVGSLVAVKGLIAVAVPQGVSAESVTSLAALRLQDSTAAQRHGQVLATNSEPPGSIVDASDHSAPSRHGVVGRSIRQVFAPPVAQAWRFREELAVVQEKSTPSNEKAFALVAVDGGAAPFCAPLRLELLAGEDAAAAADAADAA
eukprot:CAMPEP_0115129708 /NCGR_PEP_ID=MMETSP0227-20121206/51961_1 /TAXON_ID=89957 /ORGANISM="Polarella glacialis, Strain CCMP 1383" /LENGTH=161 /DNA_ID=CAMNT_0002534647 /DNA_START=215 /DNA_END=698 /DNA_ORIENTATION=-